MGKHKELFDSLQKIAAALPQVNDVTHEVHLKKGQDILNEGVITECDGKPLVPAGVYRMRYPVKMAINHLRRLKKAARHGGPAEIQKYVDSVNKLYNEQQQKLKKCS